MSEAMCDGTPFRYRVECAAGLLVGSTDDLEEAGQIYQSSSGAADIFDLEANRYLRPERDVPCIKRAVEVHYWNKQPRWRRLLHFLFPATWAD